MQPENHETPLEIAPVEKPDNSYETQFESALAADYIIQKFLFRVFAQDFSKRIDANLLKFSCLCTGNMVKELVNVDLNPLDEGEPMDPENLDHEWITSEEPVMHFNIFSQRKK